MIVSFWDGLCSGANCLFQGGYFSRKKDAVNLCRRLPTHQTRLCSPAMSKKNHPHVNDGFFVSTVFDLMVVSNTVFIVHPENWDSMIPNNR